MEKKQGKQPSFALQLKKFLDAKGITQTEFAIKLSEVAGKTIQTQQVSRWLLGKVAPTAKTKTFIYEAYPDFEQEIAENKLLIEEATADWRNLLQRGGSKDYIDTLKVVLSDIKQVEISVEQYKHLLEKNVEVELQAFRMLRDNLRETSVEIESVLNSYEKRQANLKKLSNYTS